MSKWTCSHCNAINPTGSFKCHNCPNTCGDEYWFTPAGKSARETMNNLSVTPLDHILKRIEDLEAIQSLCEDQHSNAIEQLDALEERHVSLPPLLRALKILANHAYSIEISTSPLSHSAMLGLAQAAKELGHVTS